MGWISESNRITIQLCRIKFGIKTNEMVRYVRKSGSKRIKIGGTSETNGIFGILHGKLSKQIKMKFWYKTNEMVQ